MNAPSPEEVDAKLAAAEARVETRLISIESKLDKQFDRLSAKMDVHYAELNAKIEKQGAELNAKIDKQGADLEAKIHRSNVEIIKWVAGMGITLAVLGLTVMTFVLNNAVPKTVSVAPAPPQPIIIYGPPPQSPSRGAPLPN